LLGKHPDTSIIATLDEQGKLVLPRGKEFTPDSSVRINIVGHSEALEKVGATKLAKVTLSSPMDKIMLYLFLPLLFRFKASWSSEVFIRKIRSD
jgi:hypothetical protein